MRIDRLLANLGYGSRKEVQRFIKSGLVTNLAGEVLKEKSKAKYSEILFSGEVLEPEAPLTIMLHKPVGYTCSTEDPGKTIYDLLPSRFQKRNPILSSVGRLDKDTSGLLLMTDDGQLLHSLINPKKHVAKVYHVELDRPLQGDEGDRFLSGELLLRNEIKPLLPAELEVLGEREARITLYEGRYHQVRRMFAAVGNHVNALKRISIGGVSLLEDLKSGEWMRLEEVENILK